MSTNGNFIAGVGNADLSERISWSDLTGEQVRISSNKVPYSQPQMAAFEVVKPWSQLAEKPEILPHYETRAKSIVKTRLGYIPSANAMNPYDPFLRAIAYVYDHGQIGTSTYDAEAESLVRQIRNKDILMFDAITLPQQEYAEYELRKNTFGCLFVRERLTRFLDQVPELKYSLQAELMMQQVVDESIVKFDVRPNETDIRALTIIGYRMVLLTEGKQAADASPLWYYDFAMTNGYFNEPA